MTKEIKKAVKRFCEDYDFENLKEIKEYAKDMSGDIIDEYWFADAKNEERCYNELTTLILH